MTTPIAPLSYNEYQGTKDFLFYPRSRSYTDEEAIFKAMPSHKRLAAITHPDYYHNNHSAIGTAVDADEVYILLAGLSPTERLVAITAFDPDGQNALMMCHQGVEFTAALLDGLTPDQQWEALNKKNKGGDNSSALDLILANHGHGNTKQLDNLLEAVHPSVIKKIVDALAASRPDARITMPASLLHRAFENAGRLSALPNTPIRSSAPAAAPTGALIPGGGGA